MNTENHMEKKSSTQIFKESLAQIKRDYIRCKEIIGRLDELYKDDVLYFLDKEEEKEYENTIKSVSLPVDPQDIVDMLQLLYSSYPHNDDDKYISDIEELYRDKYNQFYELASISTDKVVIEYFEKRKREDEEAERKKRENLEQGDKCVADFDMGIRRLSSNKEIADYIESYLLPSHKESLVALFNYIKPKAEKKPGMLDFGGKKVIKAYYDKANQINAKSMSLYNEHLGFIHNEAFK